MDATLSAPTHHVALAPNLLRDGALEFIEFEVQVLRSCMWWDCLTHWLCRRLLLLAGDVEPHPGPARNVRHRSSRRGIDLLTHDIEDTTRRIYETRLEEMRSFYALSGLYHCRECVGSSTSCRCRSSGDLPPRTVPDVEIRPFARRAAALGHQAVFVVGGSGGKIYACRGDDPRTIASSTSQLVEARIG